MLGRPTFVQPIPGNWQVGFSPTPRPRDTQAWKAAMGKKPVGARLELLDIPQPRASALGASFIFQCFVATLVVVLPMLFPQQLIPATYYEVADLLMPRTEVPLPPPPPKVRVKTPTPVEKPIEPPKVAKLMAPPKPVIPKPKPVEARTPEAPKLNPDFAPTKIAAAPAQPARPRDPVKTGMMSTGSAAPATVNRPVSQVQTGGFGDPDGIAGKGDPNKRANIAQKGSFSLPGGPGYGNGTGGAKGVRGTVASTGFGNGIAIPPTGGGGGNRGSVKQAGFGDASAAAAQETPRQRKVESTSPTTPVEILFKPDPAYTQEARALKLEGEVLLNVVFEASGNIRIKSVVRGLGHGLDESATRSAQQIRFKPARRDGQPVDFPAVVHIVFQLAY
jgi:TonB family protein